MEEDTYIVKDEDIIAIHDENPGTDSDEEYLEQEVEEEDEPQSDEKVKYEEDMEAEAEEKEELAMLPAAATKKQAAFFLDEDSKEQAGRKQVDENNDAVLYEAEDLTEREERLQQAAPQQQHPAGQPEANPEPEDPQDPTPNPPQETSPAKAEAAALEETPKEEPATNPGTASQQPTNPENLISPEPKVDQDGDPTKPPSADKLSAVDRFKLKRNRPKKDDQDPKTTAQPNRTEAGQELISNTATVNDTTEHMDE